MSLGFPRFCSEPSKYATCTPNFFLDVVDVQVRAGCKRAYVSPSHPAQRRASSRASCTSAKGKTESRCCADHTQPTTENGWIQLDEGTTATRPLGVERKHFTISTPTHLTLDWHGTVLAPGSWLPAQLLTQTPTI